MTPSNGSKLHLSASTPTTSMCAISSTGPRAPVPRSLATSAARPGDGSMSFASIPSRARIDASSRARYTSLPGGFTVTMRMHRCRLAMISPRTASQSGSIAGAGVALRCIIDQRIRSLSCEHSLDRADERRERQLLARHAHGLLASELPLTLAEQRLHDPRTRARVPEPILVVALDECLGQQRLELPRPEVAGCVEARIDVNEGVGGAVPECGRARERFHV